jgi:integrase
VIANPVITGSLTLREPSNMSRQASRLPTYRLHKPSGQAVVTLAGKDYYLGPHGTEASKAEYDRVISLWIAGGRGPLQQTKGELAVAELILAYWKHVEVYYVKAGRPTSQVRAIRRSMRTLKHLFGSHPVNEFGPLALKAVRQQFLDDGLARGVINGHVDRIRLMFRWGVEHELIPESIYSALKAVRSLPRGRTTAKDHPPIGPAPDAAVEATLPFLRAPVRAMVELQLLTGMRPGEVVALRACDIDRTGDVWVYRVTDEVNKTEHHDRDRTVYLGPKAQAILKPWLEQFPDGPLFRPKGWNRAKFTKPRKTLRRVRPQFMVTTYWMAVRDACRKAKVEPWHPNQLRHNAATRLRRDYGLDAARIVLGHADVKTSEIYAERDMCKAIEVMREVG